MMLEVKKRVRERKNPVEMLRFYSENMSKKLLTRASDYSTGLAGEGDRNIDKPTNNSMDAILRRIFSAYMKVL